VSVDRCLENLDEAIAAARSLGLDASAAIRIGETARARLGFPSSAYVLALVGGTGVGKSTLLNAIAGEKVSLASARRPTTSDAVAWVSSSRGRELASLLKWLGVKETREHAGGALADVAVLDLPDFDSIALEHRERVDALLPRVDAVAWIVDPEKYMDDVMHGGYLREFAPRIRRQIVVLNRSDLLSNADASRVADDMRAQLRRDGAGDIDVIATRAREGAAGIGELREWLESAVEAKHVVASRVAAEVRGAVRGLAADAGVVETHAALIEPARRERAVSAVARGALAVIDIAGLEQIGRARVGKGCRSLCDWSSDVCSSDLRMARIRGRGQARGRVSRGRGGARGSARSRRRRRRRGNPRRAHRAGPPRARRLCSGSRGARRDRHCRSRADRKSSCRERV